MAGRPDLHVGTCPPDLSVSELCQQSACVLQPLAIISQLAIMPWAAQPARGIHQMQPNLRSRAMVCRVLGKDVQRALSIRFGQVPGFFALTQIKPDSVNPSANLDTKLPTRGKAPHHGPLYPRAPCGGEPLQRSGNTR